MRLDEFIKETLLQIAKGVQDAIDEQKGFEINPNEKEAEIQTIKFSISLSTETKAEAGIKVLSAAHDTTSLNKIDFEVKMRLPKTHKEGKPKPPSSNPFSR